MHATKEKIYTSSKELLSKFGYANFTIGLVTKTLHISKGIVNYHYPQKEMLLEDIVEEFKITFNQALSTINLDKVNKDSLYQYFHIYYDFYKEHTFLMKAYYEIICNHHHVNGELIYSLTDHLDILRTMIKKGQELKIYQSFDIDMIIFFIENNLMSCFYHHEYSKKQRDELYQMINQSLITKGKPL